MSSPKDRAGPPRVTEHNEDRDIMTEPGAMYRACVDSGPAYTDCKHLGRGCAKEDDCDRSARTCALAKYFDFLDDFKDPNKCRWEPGSKECGCATAPYDNMLPSCSGTYGECVGYGNEQNFGGFPRMPEAQDFPQVRTVIARAAEALERGDFVVLDLGAEDPVFHVDDPTDHILNGWNEELVTPVTAFEVDGEIYQTLEEAQVVAAKSAFIEWYEQGADNVLYGRYEGSRIDGDKMLEWIEENAPVLLKLLKTMV